jgi:hypothetical protein
VAVALGQRVWLMRGTWFYLDDWPIMVQARRGDFLEPYNGHLSAVMVAMYRAHLEVFGLSHYIPLRLLGALAGMALAVGMFLSVRRYRPAAVAAVLTVPLLWSVRMTFPVVFTSFLFSLVAGVGCAALLRLPSTRRLDLALGGLLGFSICSSAVGVPVGIACLVHNLLARGSRRRWLAAIVPVAGWALWWLAMGRDAPPSVVPFTRHRVHGLEWARLAGLNLGRSFQQLGLGNRVVGAVLFAGFAVEVIRLVRTGGAARANAVAWTTALVVWQVGLIQTRSLHATDDYPFRYAYVATVFALLAVTIPARPATRTLPAGAVVAVAILFAVASWGDARVNAETERDAVPTIRHFVADVRAGRRETGFSPLEMYIVPAEQVRELLRKYW